MSPTAAVEVPVQRQMTNLDTLEDVVLQKVVTFVPVTRPEEALQYLNNDAERFLDVINRGLRAEIANNAVKDSSIPWMYENEEGELVPFTGTLADTKAINNLVLNMAKTMFGYNKDMPIEKRRAAKKSALDIIKNTEAIREALKATTKAALEAGE